MQFQIIAFAKDYFSQANGTPGTVIAKFKTREAAEKRAREKNLEGRGRYMVFPID
jgi:hypothetical protein